MAGEPAVEVLEGGHDGDDRDASLTSAVRVGAYESGHAREPPGAAAAAPADEREDDRQPPGRGAGGVCPHHLPRHRGPERRGGPDLRRARSRRRGAAGRRLPNPPHRPHGRGGRGAGPLGPAGRGLRAGPGHGAGRRPAQGRCRPPARAPQPGGPDAGALPPRRAGLVPAGGAGPPPGGPLTGGVGGAAGGDPLPEARRRGPAHARPPGPRPEGRRLVPGGPLRPYALVPHLPGGAGALDQGARRAGAPSRRLRPVHPLGPGVRGLPRQPADGPRDGARARGPALAGALRAGPHPVRRRPGQRQRAERRMGHPHPPVRERGHRRATT